MPKVKCSYKPCGKRFERGTGRSYGMLNWCSEDCHVNHAMASSGKGRKIKEREERKERRQAKERLKTRSDWMKEAQAAFNAYVRARDYGKLCIACNTPMAAQKLGGMVDCSHYRSVGSAPHKRFFLHNVAASCKRCNRDLSGNIVEMRKGLISRIGEAKVLAVEADETIRRFDINYLKRIKKIFSKKARLKGARE